MALSTSMHGFFINVATYVYVLGFDHKSLSSRARMVFKQEWRSHECLKTNSDMSAEARVAKDSDGKSYTHSCCSWKVTCPHNGIYCGLKDHCGRCTAVYSRNHLKFDFSLRIQVKPLSFEQLKKRIL